jgi:hypothetical protein
VKGRGERSQRRTGNELIRRCLTPTDMPEMEVGECGIERGAVRCRWEGVRLG